MRPASFLGLGLTFAFCSISEAQISIVNSGAGSNAVNVTGWYVQNFNSVLPTTNTTGWTNNVTLPGWIAVTGSANPTNAYTNIVGTFASPTNTVAGTLYSVPQHFDNNTPNSAYRAIAMAPSGGTGPGHLVLRFVNNTTSTITGLTVSYEMRWGYSQQNSVDSFDVIAGGSGYSSNSPPTVTVTGGTPNAGGTSVVNSSGNLSSITKTNSGSGYTSAPVVTISGTGSGALARAIMNLTTSSNSVGLSYRVFSAGQGTITNFSSGGWSNVVVTTNKNSTSSSVPDNWNYVTAAVTNVSVAPGQEIWLNWQMVKLGSTGSSIAAIDNVRVGNFAQGNPAILTQPMAQSVILGNSATLSVAASGTGTLGYQWRKNGTNIPGATSAVFTLTNAQPIDVGNYDVVVTAGAASVTSAPVPVQVYTRVGVIGAASNNLAVAPALTNYTRNASYSDIAVANTSAYTNNFDLYLPDAPVPTSGRPAVVVIHGGGGNDGDKTDSREVQACQEFASHGYVALSINYKRSFQTKSSGNWTTAWPQNIKDAKTAVRWLRANATTYGIDPNRIGAIGFSWGGNEAAMLATTDGDPALDPSAEDGLGVQSTKVACAANFYGAVQIPDYHNMNQFAGNGVPGSAGTMDNPTNSYLLASPATRATNTAAPMLLSHGDADLEVMPTQNEALRASLINTGASVVSVMIPGGKHSYSLYETDATQGGSTNNPIDVRAHTLGFYDKYLLPRAPTFTCATNLTFAKGSVFSNTVTANHAPTQFAATGLPAGWSINPTNGQITGTMPSSGSQTVTVYATGASGTAVSTLTFTTSESITVSNVVVGTTPSLLGYNLGHFTDKGNGFDWFRYSGVKGARVFMSASELQSQTSPGRTVVTSESAFWDTISKARSLGTSRGTYIRWTDFNYDYTSTSGNNDITFKYAFTQLRSLGVDILVNITASPGTFPITSSSDWAGKWELWQHYYAQAYLLARDYDVRRFSMFNEPNNWAGMTEADWFQRLRICSDAIQKAIADVNAVRGKSLVPRIYAPNTANGKEKYNTSVDTWGRDTILNRYLQLSGLTGSSWSPVTNPVSLPWRLSHVYNYQKYSMQTDDDSGLTGFITDINALKGLIAGDLGGEALPPIALTEYNVRTGSTYDTKTENQDTPSDYVALGANSVALAANGAEELFLFKFGQTDSGGVNYGVAKNGTHYVQNGSGTDNNYGGATKAAEVYRLFLKAAQGGRQRYAFSASSGAASSTTSGLWTLVTRDSSSGYYYVFLANKRTSSIPLELDLSALSIPNGNPVMLEEVSGVSSSDAVPVGNVANGRIALGSIPRETVWLVTIPSAAAGLTSIFATEDTQLTDGSGRSLIGTLVNPMLVRADGTANGRKAALIKIPVSAADLAGNKTFYLDLEVASSSATNAAQAHLYGITDNSWTEGSATWAQASFLRQNIGAGSQISNNVVLNTAGSPVARMLGQLIAATNAPTRMAVEVTDFVKSQTNGFASFLVVQDHRWDYSADLVTNRTTGDIQPAGLLVTSRDKEGSGPRLLGLSAAASTAAPVLLVNPVDRFLDLGGSTALTVAFDQSLPSTIQWKKDGVAIPGANGTTFSLTNVTVADAGVYTAEVTNANGTTVSAGATVAINAAPVLVRGLGNVVATVGDPVILSADFSGYPPPSYVWRKNGTVIAGVTGSSYSFIAASDSAGTYAITADNGLGTVSSSATLTLEAAATGFLSITNTNASVTENFDTLGKTGSSGIDTTSYLTWSNGIGWTGPSSVWYPKPGWYAATDDNRSPFEGYRTLNNNGGNPSTPPPRGESGLASMGGSSSSNDRGLGGLPWTNNRVFFGVRISNGTGVPLQGFSVRYRMEQFSATTAAKSGTQLNLACAVNPISLRSPNFMNFAANSPIVTNNNSYGRKDGTSTSNSALKTNAVSELGVAPGDSVWVRWEVATTSAEPLAFSIDDLVITNFTPAVRPVITTQPSGVTTPRGQAASLAVIATGGPSPSFQWYKNSNAISGATNSTLLIDHVADEDAGSYFVQAVNVAGNTNSAVVSIVVTAPPTFSGHPLGQTVRVGTNVTLSGVATGTPTPTYQWQKDGINIPGATLPSLTLSNVSPNDSGIYSLLAINSAGTSSSDLALLNIMPVSFASIFSGASPAAVGPDGMSYLLKYAFGGTNSNSPANWPIAAYSNNELSLTYLARTNDTNLSIYPERCTELSASNSWTNTGISVSTLGTTNVDGTTVERRKASVISTNVTRQFLRIKVTSGP